MTGSHGYSQIQLCFEELPNLYFAAVICTSEATLVSPPIFFLDSYDNYPYLVLGDDSTLNLYNTLQLLRLPDKYLSLHQSVIT